MSNSKLVNYDSVFSSLSDDLLLQILFKLEDDPRHWARLSCVSTKFTSLICNVCCKTRCIQTIPAVVSDLLSASDAPPGGWASLHKLAVCCPGLVLSGILLENSDFGLERELGPEENYLQERKNASQSSWLDPVASSSNNDLNTESTAIGSDCCWSLFDDLLFDTMYDNSESSEAPTVCAGLQGSDKGVVVKPKGDFVVCKQRKVCRSLKSHLASGVWNLSREQGNKLLASRFKGDCLYICDWPGCIHLEEKRSYMLFRGIFKNFKQSRVWRTINDGRRRMIDLHCAFCGSKQTWDLHSAFCLRSHFGFHEDGEPVVRAYVCENGHVSGAWTDWPLYT